MRAIRVHRFGGPEALVAEEIDTPTPGPGQALVRVEAAGVNYLDINQRNGSYPGALPFTPGLEAAGVVAAVGPDVADVRVGDRVAYAAAQPGAYAEAAVWPVDKLVPIPEGVTAEQAAAALFQGLTAHYLTRSAYAVQPGDHILVHAAAGGVGLLLVRMAKRRGAWVAGVVSTEEKAAQAREAGADEIILSRGVDIAAEVRRLTGGEGVHAVYDSVGRATFAASLDALRRRGTLVLFGQASGPVPALDPGVLGAKGSLTLTRPVLFDYTVTREELLWRAGEVLGGVRGRHADVAHRPPLLAQRGRRGPCAIGEPRFKRQSPADPLAIVLLILKRQEIRVERMDKPMTAPCTHLNQIQDVTPSAQGCEDCLTGSTCASA